MQRIVMAAWMLCWLSIANVGLGQHLVAGTVFTKLGGVAKGKIRVNLAGPNDYLIEVTNEEKTKEKGRRTTITTTQSLNTAIISYLLIGDSKYYFRKIKVGYDEKYLDNVCVQLVHGTLDCGVFQVGNGSAPHTIAIKFPKDALSELVSIDFEYYKASTSVAMKVVSCKPLLEKFSNKDESVSWTENASREQRVERFKNIVTEYNACKTAE